MTNKVIITKSKLNNIGDAIRDRLDSTTKYTLDEMPDKIRSISGGGGGGGADGILTQVIVMPKPIITADWTWIQ